MKYLCLIYHDETIWQKMPKEEADAVYKEYFSFTEEIGKSDHYPSGNPLQPTHTATTVRVRNGKTSTTDGPFAETKEELGGYYLIDGKDLNDVLQVASRIPGARFGSIEVRPVMAMPQS
ncbi:MAG: YciI family protein [Gemmatimonadaceae bacterium]